MFQSKIATLLRKEYVQLEDKTFDAIYSNKYEEQNPGLTDENEHKNRYLNIVPAIKTLVTGPYINANFISYASSQDFIATQAPLPQTFDDFYDMVFKYSDAIVMLTDYVEKGKPKADQYIPVLQNILETQNYFVYTASKVTILKQIDLSQLVIGSKEDYSDIELFKQKLTQLFAIGCPRDLFNKQRRQLSPPLKCVAHYHLRTWPDREQPETMALLHEFVLLTRRATFPIVHCSAGVGRTGVFIACYWLYEMKSFGRAESRSVSVPVMSEKKSSIQLMMRSAIGSPVVPCPPVSTPDFNRSPVHRHDPFDGVIAQFQQHISTLQELTTDLKEINEMVLEMRIQRSYAMVQTPEQYRFIFEYGEYLEVLFHNNIV